MPAIPPPTKWFLYVHLILWLDKCAYVVSCFCLLHMFFLHANIFSYLIVTSIIIYVDFNRRTVKNIPKYAPAQFYVDNVLPRIKEKKIMSIKPFVDRLG